jgi:hypothetical protein
MAKFPDGTRTRAAMAASVALLGLTAFLVDS